MNLPEIKHYHNRQRAEISSRANPQINHDEICLAIGKKIITATATCDLIHRAGK